MFKKENRLTKKKEFDNVFQNGRSCYSKTLGVRIVDNKLSDSRFGIMVSTKVSKKAIERNLIKRQIREIIKNELENLKTDKDCVIITLPLILGKKYQEIEKDLKYCFKRLSLYKTKSK